MSVKKLNCLSKAEQSDVKGGRLGNGGRGFSGILVTKTVGENGRVSYSCANCTGCTSPCSNNIIVVGG